MAEFKRADTSFIARLGIALGIGITFAMVVLTWLGPSWLARLSNTLLDFQFTLRGARDVGAEIILVLVDEKSLNELGRWPWPRDTQSQLIDRITADHPRVIGLDIIYAEAEESESARGLKSLLAKARSLPSLPAALKAKLNETIEATDTDKVFARSLQSAGNIVLAVPLFVPEIQGSKHEVQVRTPQRESLTRSEFMLVKQAKGGEDMEPFEATAALPPLKQLSISSAALGHVYRQPDEDGITRREYLALRYRDAYYPSFALELARVYLNVPRERMALLLGQGVQLGTILLPSDQKARMLINYAGGERSFSWVSATDVIHRRIPSGLFKDKAVLVGTSALGTYDQLTTPFSANFPGVEKNATVVENIIHRQFLHAGLWMGPLEIGLILLVGLTLTYSLPRLRALYGTMLTGFVVAGYAGTAHAFFALSDICVPILTPLLTIVSVFTVTTVLSYIMRENQAKHLHDMFSSYVSPKIVEELIKSPWKAKLGGERKELTMLFADLSGFTAFSEKRPAEEVVAQLNEYLVAMTEVVFRWHGTLDKFVGDEIVVFWGAPLDQPDHVELAVKCALHMRDRLAQLHVKWTAEGKPLLDNGIGINTGMAVVGNIGAEGKKIDYTMIGDQVNLASRFQKLTRKAGCPILITEHTAERLKQLITAEDRGDNKGRLGHICLTKLGAVKLKGKEQLVGAYSIQSLSREEQSRVDEDANVVAFEVTDKLEVTERDAAA